MRLFLVATPIGNLEDITLRALRVLAEVPLIAAEDTRMARRLLSHFNIAAPTIVSYNDHTRQSKIPAILDALVDGDAALVTDAGMPGISDPGYDLVVAAIGAGHDVVPLPGASAVIAAVAASGLPSRRFHYLGFLPRQGGARRTALREAAATGDTMVVFESPHRVVQTLEDARTALGSDRRIAICRELTKLHEEIWRGTISGAIAHFAHPRGEFVLVIEGRDTEPAPPTAETIEQAIAEIKSAGATSKDGVAQIAQRFGMPRREAYRRWHGT